MQGQLRVFKAKHKLMIDKIGLNFALIYQILPQIDLDKFKNIRNLIIKVFFILKKLI